MGGSSRIGVVILILLGIFAYLKTGSTLFMKVKSSGARLQMRSIDRALQAYSFKSKRYPKNFVSFMRKSFDSKNGKDSSLDPWGFQYKYESSAKGFTLASAGLDGKFGTEDDLAWVRNGNQAGMEQGVSRFKGVATAEVKTSSKVVASNADDAQVNDYKALFSPTSLGDTSETKLSDKELLKFLELYLEQVIIE